MIQYSQQPKDKEIATLTGVIKDTTDFYSDFYITKQNLRLMIRDNLDLFFKCLQGGDKIVWDEYLGIILITGFSDKAERIYIRPLFKDEQSAYRLLKNVNNLIFDIDLWAKVKKNSPVKNVLLRMGYKFIASRGREVLMCRPKLIKKEVSNATPEN